MTEPFLYVVLSATPTRTGAFIRRYTRNPFNHISISFDSKLEPLYSFARHFYSTPFYGGFVKESLCRYHLKGSAAHLRVFRIPVSQEQLDQLNRHIDYMLSRQDQYLYNHISALAVPFKKTVKAPDSYTCVEFCVEILHNIGLSVTPGKFYSLKQLEQLLLPYAHYTGPAPVSDYQDTVYYASKPLPHTIRSTVSAFCTLIKRL